MDSKKYDGKGRFVLLLAMIGVAALLVFALKSQNIFSQKANIAPMLVFTLDYLPKNTLWTATVTNTMTGNSYTQNSYSQINFTLPSGTYDYTIKMPGYLIAGSPGTLIYHSQTDEYVQLNDGIINCKRNCIPGTYELQAIFVPQNTLFTAAFENSSGEQTRSTNITFVDPNTGIVSDIINFTVNYGTYNLIVPNHPISGYATSLYNVSSLNFSEGQGITQLAFVECPYYDRTCNSPRELLIFQNDNKIPANAEWVVTMQNSTGSLTENSTTQYINFSLAPGLYSYSINSVEINSIIYQPSPASGNLNMSVGPLYSCISVKFEPQGGSYNGANQNNLVSYGNLQGEQRITPGSSLCPDN
jgi:hypothetical protein